MTGRSLWIPRNLLAAAVRGVIGTITHVSTKHAVAALTFDDGPHPEYTPRLLEILECHQARATFFVVGEAAQQHRDLVRRLALAGHAIGNHTWDHPSFPAISGRERRSQLWAWEKAVAPYGHRLFRPPYGHQSLASCLDVRLSGYQTIGYNLVAHDWLDHDATWMVEWLVDQITPGSVVLFHDALYSYVDERFVDREPMLAAVDMLLGRLGDRFRFVTVPALLRCGRPQRRNLFQTRNPDWLKVKDHKRVG